MNKLQAALLAVSCLMASAGPAFAQFPRPVPPRRPTVSPYLNLVRRGAPLAVR